VVAAHAAAETPNAELSIPGTDHLGVDTAGVIQYFPGCSGFSPDRPDLAENTEIHEVRTFRSTFPSRTIGKPRTCELGREAER